MSDILYKHSYESAQKSPDARRVKKKKKRSKLKTLFNTVCELFDLTSTI